MLDTKTQLLNRRAAAEFLKAMGYSAAPASLAKWACLGGGPEFIRFGRQILYAEDDLLRWVTGRSTRHKSTSDPGSPLAIGKPRDGDSTEPKGVTP